MGRSCSRFRSLGHTARVAVKNAASFCCLRGNRDIRPYCADIGHAVASIPKTFTLGIREKHHEAGRVFGCSVDVGELSSFNALFEIC